MNLELHLISLTLNSGLEADVKWEKVIEIGSVVLVKPALTNLSFFFFFNLFVTKFKTGNTCKSMADSFQCMTKPTTIKKIKKCKKFKKLILIVGHYYVTMNFPDGSVVKNRPATERDADSFSVSGRSPGEGNGNPL